MSFGCTCAGAKLAPSLEASALHLLLAAQHSAGPADVCNRYCYRRCSVLEVAGRLAKHSHYSGRNSGKRPVFSMVSFVSVSEVEIKQRHLKGPKIRANQNSALAPASVFFYTHIYIYIYIFKLNYVYIFIYSYMYVYEFIFAKSYGSYIDAKKDT